VHELEVTSGGTTLGAEVVGNGSPVLLLHGLTATRRYVTMGSRSLERSGHRVISYDARGHGVSSPAAQPAAYGYCELVGDAEAVLANCASDRAVLAGASMGAHTALALTLLNPERVAGLVIITPGYDPATFSDRLRLQRWDALAQGLRGGGVDGFMAAYRTPSVPASQRPAVLTAVRQRLERHAHPGAVADALSAVARSAPFPDLSALARIAVPCVVVASRDEFDPEHPYALAAAYAGTIPDAELVSEQPGRSPLAWQGAQVSAVIAALAARCA